jgi:hypothetical protein
LGGLRLVQHQAAAGGEDLFCFLGWVRRHGEFWWVV